VRNAGVYDRRDVGVKHAAASMPAGVPLKFIAGSVNALLRPA